MDYTITLTDTEKKSMEYITTDVDDWITKNSSTRISYSERRAEYVNGSTGNGGYYSDWCTLIVSLSANDYVWVQCRIASREVHNNPDYSTFSGTLLG